MGGGEIVSVLFTDLVGSTELLDQLGDDAAERVRQVHFGLLREAVRARRGHEVKNLGDGLMVVFPSALDALDCAIAMQRRVRRHNREGQAAPLHVRVGVHVGEPIRNEGDYFGTTVNVAKRLCDRAAADQILTSQLVVDLVGSRGGFTFRALGPLELKGIGRPVPAVVIEWQSELTGGADQPLEYRVLGPVEVCRADDGARIPLASSLQRLLLSLLLANAGEVTSADRLVDALWSDNLPADPQDALQSHISRLRRRLGQSVSLETTPVGYRFTAPELVDATRFERLVADAGQATTPEAALDAWTAALSLWRGRAFFDLADHPALQPAAVRLERLRMEAEEARAETLLGVGRVIDALGAAQALCTAEPLRERPVALAVRALAASGRYVEALRTYDEFRRRLADEVGLDPSPELRALEGEILRHERSGGPGGEAEVSGRDPGPPPGLPVAVTSFVGRENTLAAVIRALGSSRLVTLIGPGGMGKTRLALETVRRHIGVFGHGASLCELGPVVDAAAVPFALAAAVGVRQLPGATIEESLLEGLAARNVLLVVDNCEHLLDAVVPLLERILGQCPDVNVIATSRERLAAQGEAVVEVPPLDVPDEGSDPATTWAQAADAVELLCDRVAAIRPGFAPDSGQRAVLIEIARRLDGLPLALELAAARIATMGPAEVVSRLDDPFSLLTRGRRSAPDRHRTLRGTVEWSYRLLDEAEQRAFERATVFAGGFTLDAAEAVCAAAGNPASEDVAELVSALVDKSMIIVDDRGPNVRYRMLETLRQFGRERLVESGRLAALEEAHARYYVKLAWQAEPHLRGPGEAECVRRLNEEVPNLRAARSWAMRSGHPALVAELLAALFWFGYWRNPEMIGWAEELVDAHASAAGPHLVHVLTAAGTAAWRRDDLAGAHALGERILAVAGDDPSARYGCQVLAIAAVLEGRFLDGCESARRMAELARSVGDHYHAAQGFGMLALGHSYSGDDSAAIATLGVNRVEAVRSGAPSALAYNAFVLGEMLAATEPDQALVHLDRAVVLSDTVGADFIHNIALVSATSLRVRHSDPATAAPALASLIDHWERSGNWRQQWTTLRHAVELFSRLGDDKAAAVVLGAIEANDTSLFGADAERLSALRAALQARLGPAADAHLADGRALPSAEVVAFTRRQLVGRQPLPV